MREGRYWEGEEKRKCRICGWAEESWKHVVEVCMGEGRGAGRQEILRILGDEGRGESWMRQLLDRRREREERKKGGTETDGQWTERMSKQKVQERMRKSEKRTIKANE